MANTVENIQIPATAEASGDFFKTLLENAFDGIGVIASDGTIKFHSPSLKRILGWEPDFGNGKTFFEFVHKEDIPKCRKVITDVLKNPGETVGCIVRFLHKDASYRFCETKSVNLIENPLINGIIVNYHDITEKYLMEQSLMESEEQYRSLVENTFDGITVVDYSGKVKFHNQALLKILGYAPERGIGKSIFELIHPDDLKAARLVQVELRQKKHEITSGLVRFKHNDGHWVILEARGINLLDKRGIQGLLINYRDVTESRKIKRALRESEERYRTIVDNASEAIAIVDADTRLFIDVNEGATALFGYSREELLRKGPLKISPKMQPDGKDSKEAGWEKIKQALQGEKVVFEWLYRHADGKDLICEVRLVRFPPYEKNLIRGTILDISARKEIERKLKDQEKDYRHLASISPVGIFKTDHLGRCIYVNNKWCDISGLSAKEALGMGWLKAIHPDDRQKLSKEWQKTLGYQRTARLEYRLQAPDGRIAYIYVQTVPDFDETGQFKGFIGTVTDITERARTEAALKKSEERNAALLNAIPDMIFRVSKEGILLDFKPANDFDPIMPPEKFLGKKIKDVLPADIARTAMNCIKKALKSKNPSSFEYTLSNADNKKSYFEARVVASAKDEAFVLVRDFTGERESQISIRKSEERWKSLVHNAPQYILTVDEKDRITFVNNLKLIKPEKIIGKKVQDILKNSIDADIDQILSDARKGNIQEMEFSIDLAGGRMWLNIRIAPIYAHGLLSELIVMALDITERKKAEQNLQETNQKLKNLYHRLETIREEEKKNISREIHDELGQELTALKLGMFWIQQYLDRPAGELDISKVQQKVKSLIELSSQTINSARSLAQQLRPVVLDNLGLIPAIESQIKTLNESADVKCWFKHNIENANFKKDFSVALFRIIQESLTNIMRHSKATEANVSLNLSKNELALVITDNGKGITEKDLNRPGKFGILGMHERVKSWNGQLFFKKLPRKGTMVKGVFALKKIRKIR